VADDIISTINVLENQPNHCVVLPNDLTESSDNNKVMINCSDFYLSINFDGWWCLLLVVVEHSG
jgi:hypothetical protein